MNKIMIMKEEEEIEKDKRNRYCDIQYMTSLFYLLLL